MSEMPGDHVAAVRPMSVLRIQGRVVRVLSAALMVQNVRVLQRAKQWARTLKRDVVALWLAARDPRVPWYAKAMAGAVAAYALSPIDLIPDFIPIVGYLDDLVIVPAGIALTIRLIPAPLMDEFRAQASAREDLSKRHSDRR